MLFLTNPLIGNSWWKLFSVRTQRLERHSISILGWAILANWFQRSKIPNINKIRKCEKGWYIAGYTGRILGERMLYRFAQCLVRYKILFSTGHRKIYRKTSNIITDQGSRIRQLVPGENSRENFRQKFNLDAKSATNPQESLQKKW